MPVGERTTSVAKKKATKRTPEPATFGDLFKAIREAAGFQTMYELAKAISEAQGVDLGRARLKSAGTIGSIENSKTLPKLGTLVTMFGHVGWEVVYDVKNLRIQFQPKGKP